MPAEFKADLNPKSSGMGLSDMLKMDEAMTKKKLYDDAIKAQPKSKIATPGADAVMNLKSSPGDVGVPFKFGNNNQSD